MATKKRTVRTTRSGRRDHHGDPRVRNMARKSKETLEVRARDANYAGSKSDRVRVGGDAASRAAEQKKAHYQLRHLDPSKRGVAVYPNAGGRPNRNERLLAYVSKGGTKKYVRQTRVEGKNGKMRWKTAEDVPFFKVSKAILQIGSGRTKRAVLGG